MDGKTKRSSSDDLSSFEAVVKLITLIRTRNDVSLIMVIFSSITAMELHKGWQNCNRLSQLMKQFVVLLVETWHHCGVLNVLKDFRVLSLHLIDLHFISTLTTVSSLFSLFFSHSNWQVFFLDLWFLLNSHAALGFSHSSISSWLLSFFFFFLQ